MAAQFTVGIWCEHDRPYLDESSTSGQKGSLEASSGFLDVRDYHDTSGKKGLDKHAQNCL